MDERKELTKNLIASGVKELMLSQNFEKITIRMIAEKAGIIRPTFYYHFQDKYEVLEWIVKSQLLQPVKALFEKGMFDESVRCIFKSIEKNIEFYRKAFEIRGQNSFWEIMVSGIQKFLLEETTLPVLMQNKEAPEKLTKELVALHFAFNLTATINIWIKSASGYASEDISIIFKYLNEHSITDILKI